MNDFPRRASALTLAWLQSALDVDLVGFALTPIGQQRGNLGEIVRIDVSHAPDATDATSGTGTTDATDRAMPLRSVVAKFAADRAESLAAAHHSGLFEREIQFYEHIAPELGSLAPRCFASEYDPATSHFVLLLEDLSTTEAELDVVTGIGPTMTAHALASLATLHLVGGPIADEFTWLQPMTHQPRFDNLRRLIQAGWPQLIGWCGDFIDPAIGARLGDAIESTMRDLQHLPQTIVHGDVKPDNMAVRQDKSGDMDVVLLDWQAVGRGPASWDVAHCLIQSLTIEDRRAHQDQLLADYPVALEGLEASFLMGLVVAAALPALGDANNPRLEQLVRVTAERSIAALSDYGVKV